MGRKKGAKREPKGGTFEPKRETKTRTKKGKEKGRKRGGLGRPTRRHVRVRRPGESAF